MNSVPPPLPQSKPPGWWTRHWKWAVPVCAITAVGIMAGFAFLIFTTIFGFMKSSEPFKVAMSRANASPQVTAALGTPVESGMMMSGNISTSESTGSVSTGHATFAIPISGPKGKANLHVEADKSAAKWTYKILEVEIPGQTDRIDLRP
jgi:hypothetical protein